MINEQQFINLRPDRIIENEFDPAVDLKTFQQQKCSFEKNDKNTQHFYGQGKLLLTGEYFVLNGAKALALPTQVGQSLHVRYAQSFRPTLNWKSFDVRENLWLEANFEFWHFNCLDHDPPPQALMLQKVLRQARKQNSHFLRDDVDVFVETHLGFPLDWGLGSSSTFIYNVAQWAYTSPFELQFKTLGGSGYDIACAQSEGPIVYHKNQDDIKWEPIYFAPEFASNLYFVFLGTKQDSRQAIQTFDLRSSGQGQMMKQAGEEISRITETLSQGGSFDDFCSLVRDHEMIVSEAMGLERVKEKRFHDYWGEVKSLGAWGGDFVLATSQRSEKETIEYFKSKGHQVILPYRKLILDSSFKNLPSDSGDYFVH